MTTIQSRRRLIVIILLCVAVGGAVLRYSSAPGSTARDVGTMLMLLWLPVIGNVIAWLIAKVWRPSRAEPTGFDLRLAFSPHVRVELTMRPPDLPSQDTPVPAGEHRCALVVDNEGFSARWFVPPGGAFPRGHPKTVEVELLAPALAMQRFERDVPFRMLVGESFVADGRVLEWLGPR